MVGPEQLERLTPKGRDQQECQQARQMSQELVRPCPPRHKAVRAVVLRERRLNLPSHPMDKQEPQEEAPEPVAAFPRPRGDTGVWLWPSSLRLLLRRYVSRLVVACS